VQKHFHNVDMQRQGVLLTTALMVIERSYIHPTPAIELYLKYLGTKHKDLGIETDLYSRWIQAMLETLAKFHGHDWSQELHTQWREAFERATDLMLLGYNEHITV
jgi:hemoglobin-like flavoprotein